jgi:esterase/lipase superfamily enzyme
MGNFLFLGEMYDRDLESSDESVDDLVQFLNDLQRTIPATRTVLVAHSMGNRLLLHALLNAHLSLRDQYRAVVLLSPDVSTDELRMALPTLDREAYRVALYVNANDLALFVSMARHLDRRAGATEVLDPSGKMETIDITSGS